ncbi:DUF3168 domain-containing protein [Metabacillus fastidiosus]|uniref:DUF3168 domain-containing protein n=1 Tax=Metabacillus fastidiosus TaxID=1458 RepID=UPI0008248ED4|nr:DUF3168 domain-containing protein [Metabacillus fastidiosus]MED4461861.1 DUF3168 domain-containing protein [Metabacillus fastidiosus]
MSYETALWELQKAIYQRLSSDPVISGMVTGVFDAVPENQAYPYVVIGEPSELPFDTKSTFGEEISIVIHVWSDYAGKKETYNILNACLKSLSYKLDIEGFKLLKVERRGMTVFDDIDPKIKHGVLRMRYTIQNI